MKTAAAPVLQPDVEHCRKRARSTGKHRVYRNHANAQIAAGEGRPRVESEPAERQDERAGKRHGQVVSRHRHRLTILGVLSEARTENDRARKRRHSANHVDDR